MAYCIVKDGAVLSGPLEKPAEYNGIQNFHTLSDSEIAEHGWIPALLVNYDYDPSCQTRTGPEFEVGECSVICRYTVADMDLDSFKAAKKADIAAARYSAETGGIAVNGALIATDREAQAQLNGALAALGNSFVETINWKNADGTWSELTADVVKEVGALVARHVQSCFTREQELCDQVATAATVEEVAALQWSMP